MDILKLALEAVGGYVLKLFRLPITLYEVAQASKRSAFAQNCPTCDARLIVEDSRRFDFWNYRCLKCKKWFRFPAPTAAKF